MSIYSPILAGAPNFRDLGGYPTDKGFRVRKGLLYRSESLSELTDRDLETLRKLGIRLVCDLRSDQERSELPTLWPERAPCSKLHLNVSTDLKAGYKAMTQVLLENPTEQGARQAMLLSYQQFPKVFAPHLRLLFDRLLTAEELPMVFHCAAGKDRTGFLSAMLLYALGVSQADVLYDYLLTEKLWNGPRSEVALQNTLRSIFKTSPPREVVKPLISARSEYIEAAFDAINEQYSSVNDYLEHAAGLSPQRRSRLLDLLTD